MSKTLIKTVRQYNKEPVSEQNMSRLTEIAKDYNTVKNYVYQRYSGIYSISKLYPGYTVQNEMTVTGLREQMDLPAVYFYLAIFDALGDIKNQWTQVKVHISKNISANTGFTDQERHYLRFVLKINQLFAGILTGIEPVLEKQWKEAYRERSTGLDTGKLNKYLCRQVRKYLKKPCAGRADGFSISERAYRYADHGIYISTKEKRKRVFVPLTDNNRYKKQLYIRLKPEEQNLVLYVPIQTRVKPQEKYTARTGLAFGLLTMFVTDNGRVYGGEYGAYQFALSECVRNGMMVYRKNQKYNPGRKKYLARKARLEAALHTYVNGEINRLIEYEKPAVLFIPRLPQSTGQGKNKVYNQSFSLWQRGFIRKRLKQKCAEKGIILVEVIGKDISRECSCCGSAGRKENENFICSVCGLQISKRENTARNALKRGIAQQSENQVK